VRAILIGALLASAAAPAGAADWGQMYGYVQWTNDYRYLGYSESNRHSAEQGGLHWAGPDGFYAGVFVTGVDFKDYRNTSYETDLYAGKHVRFDANDLNLEVLYADYPDTAGHPTYLPPGVILPTYNFFEAAADLTRTVGRWKLGLKLTAEPRPRSHGGLLTVFDGHASYALTDWLEMGGHGGHQWTDRGADMNHWDVGLTATWRLQWVFDLRYYATDIAKPDCYGMTWCQPAMVAKITYNFLVPWP
jgi:uncharacterized protein (TIGR02001 family)